MSYSQLRKVVTTIEEFLAEANQLGCLLSNMYQCDDGTWFVAIRRTKPNWVAFYGRDKDLVTCLNQSINQARRHHKKPKRERIMVKQRIERIRVRV